ncbi:MAG: prtR [Bryobacterales bacterium]|nr:prtR [Bryobacterales bacterium]
MQQLRADIRAGNLYFSAPDSLRQRVLSTVRNPGKKPRVWPWKEMAMAASLFLVVSLGANFVFMSRDRSENRFIAQEILSEHLRSMMGGHLVDVVSSDRHTVKPWFSGKLDFSPTVKDLGPQGFPLSGGRVDYMDGRSVAALVFLHNRHVITLFTWPSSRSASDASTHNGYNTVEWTKDGMIYWAVSDLNRSDLQTFSNLYKN